MGAVTGTIFSGGAGYHIFNEHKKREKYEEMMINVMTQQVDDRRVSKHRFIESSFLGDHDIDGMKRNVEKKSAQYLAWLAYHKQLRQEINEGVFGNTENREEASIIADVMLDHINGKDIRNDEAKLNMTALERLTTKLNRCYTASIGSVPINKHAWKGITGWDERKDNYYYDKRCSKDKVQEYRGKAKDIANEQNDYLERGEYPAKPNAWKAIFSDVCRNQYLPSLHTDYMKYSEELSNEEREMENKYEEVAEYGYRRRLARKELAEASRNAEDVVDQCS